MKIAIMGPIFVNVSEYGIELSSKSLELAKRLSQKHDVSFISSVGRTSVRSYIEDEISSYGIDISHIHTENFGTGFIINSSLGEYNDIIQYPQMTKCKEYVEKHYLEIFPNFDAFILACEYYDLLEFCKHRKAVPYLYLDDSFFEYLDDDDVEHVEGVIRLNDNNISTYF